MALETSAEVISNPSKKSEILVNSFIESQIKNIIRIIPFQKIIYKNKNLLSQSHFDQNKSKEKNRDSFFFFNFSSTFIIIAVLAILGSLSFIGLIRYYRATESLKYQNNIILKRFEENEKTYDSTLEYLKKVNDIRELTSKEIQSLEQKIAALTSEGQFDSKTIEINSSTDTLMQIIELQKNIISHALKNSNQQSKYEVVLTDLIRFVEDISSKSKVVHDIAFKTKVLSFNASVEAERAGVRGRGFSIVAQEMKRLAEISGKASEEIAAIVERTRRGTQQLSQADSSNQGDLNKSLSEIQNHIEKMESVTSEFKIQISSISDAQENSKHNLREATKLINQITHAQEQLYIANHETFQYQQPWAS